MAFAALDSGLTGGLFATEAMAALFSDSAVLAAMIEAEAALARAEAAHGLAPASLAPTLSAIDPASLDLAALGRATAVAGVPTIPFVKAVQARLPDELERAFHKGATTQDIVDTALMLRVKAALDLVATDAAAIVTSLADLAVRHRETPCIGRTYGQHAAPVTFGFKAAVWVAGIAEAAQRLPALRAALPASLGGPVGTLAALGPKGPEVAEAYACALGLAPAPIAWHARRTIVTEIGAFLAILLGALAKMAGDIVHLATTEVAEVAEPFVAGRGGSSAMPHKRNPVGSTIILAAHGAASGPLATLIGAMAAAHERPAGAWHAEWHALPTLCGLASGALAEARAVAAGLVVDAPRMRANIDLTRGLVFADAAAAKLAAKLGREAAHHLVEQLAGKVRDGGRSLRDLLTEDEAARSALSPAERDAIFDLGPAVSAAALWTDRAVAWGRPIAASLTLASEPL